MSHDELQKLLMEYKKYNPYTETIIESNGGVLLVIDRYDENDYGVWWTDKEHLYDEFFGTSTRGSLEAIICEIKDEIED